MGAPSRVLVAIVVVIGCRGSSTTRPAATVVSPGSSRTSVGPIRITLPPYSVSGLALHWEVGAELVWIPPPGYKPRPLEVARKAWIASKQRSEDAGWALATELYNLAPLRTDPAEQTEMLDEALRILTTLQGLMPERRGKVAARNAYDRACILARKRVDFLDALNEAVLDRELLWSEDRIGSTALLALGFGSDLGVVVPAFDPSADATRALAATGFALRRSDFDAAASSLRFALDRWTRPGAGALFLEIIAHVAVYRPEQARSLVDAYVANPAMRDGMWREKSSAEVVAAMESFTAPITTRALATGNPLGIAREFWSPDDLASAASSAPTSEVLDAAMFAHHVFQDLGDERWRTAALALYARAPDDSRAATLRRQLAAEPGGPTREGVSVWRSTWLRSSWFDILERCGRVLPHALTRHSNRSPERQRGWAAIDGRLHVRVRVAKAQPLEVEVSGELPSVAPVLERCLREVLPRRHFEGLADRELAIDQDVSIVVGATQTPLFRGTP